MQIAFIGDSHINESQPTNRTDNYYTALLNKLEFVLKTCTENNIQYLVIPGDIFDKPVVSYGVAGDIYKLLSTYNIKPLVIVGQHDLSFRYLNERTSPVLFLELLNKFQLLTPDGVYLNDSTYIKGLSYGETEQKVIINSKCKTNILVIHRQVAPKAIGPKVEFLTAKQVVSKYGDFDLIISGDYHYKYAKKFRNTYVVNAGVLCRSTVTDMKRNHKPTMFIFDCNKKRIRSTEIPHRPAEEIFDLSAKLKASTREKIETDIKAVLATEINNIESGQIITFRDRLVKRCEQHKIGNHVVKIFDEIYTELGGENGN